jgi:sugar phosphate isomerase/epimerase
MAWNTWTLDRRAFLATCGALIVPAARGMSAATIERVGVQLYTVRDALPKDFDGTLAKIAAIGFKEVEFAGYAGKSAADVRDALKRHGLAAPAAHVDYPSLGEKWPQVLQDAATIGHTHVVNPWIDESIRKEPDSWKRIADTFNKAGEASRRAGIQFAYHNHHFEFEPVKGVLPFDTLLQSCDPELVKFELDLCWIAAAGRDPLDYFARHPGRFPLVHVKGLSKKPAEGAAAPIDQVLPTITDVGTNDTIDWPRIFAKSSQAGIRHYFVEHDVPTSPFDSLKASYTYLRGIRF